MLLFRCVQLIRKVQQHNYTTAFFCNVSPATFADRRFFHDFIQYLESCPELAPSLVFELSQDELAAQAEDAQLDLARLRAAGRSEEHTSELQSLMRISYAVFCLKKKKQNK